MKLTWEFAMYPVRCGFILGLGISLFLTSPLTPYACIEVLPDMRRLWNESGAIYEGVALEDGTDFHFQLVTAWKGDPIERVHLLWPDMADYGCYGPRPAEKGSLYLIYLREKCPLSGSDGDFGNPLYLADMSRGGFAFMRQFLESDVVLDPTALISQLEDWREGRVADAEFCQWASEMNATARVEDWVQMPDESYVDVASPSGEMIRFLAADICDCIAENPPCGIEVKKSLVSALIQFLENSDPGLMEGLGELLDERLDTIQAGLSKAPRAVEPSTQVCESTSVSTAPPPSPAPSR